MIERIVSRSGKMCFDDTVDNIQKSDELRYDWVRSHFGEQFKGKAFIDFGCWTGSTLRQMSRENPTRLVGLDIPGPWTGVAQESMHSSEIMQVEDFQKLPEGLSEQFDFAFLVGNA